MKTLFRRAPTNRLAARAHSRAVSDSPIGMSTAITVASGKRPISAARSSAVATSGSPAASLTATHPRGQASIPTTAVISSRIIAHREDDRVPQPPEPDPEHVVEEKGEESADGS